MGRMHHDEQVSRVLLTLSACSCFRSEIAQRLSGMQLPLTLLVHSDHSASIVDYSTASSTLHVRTDCSPMHLLNFVQSDRCLNAGDKAKEMLTDDIEEQRILEEARKALGAKHVIRICSVYERQQVKQSSNQFKHEILSVGHSSGRETHRERRQYSSVSGFIRRRNRN